jgi:hypothetical protein
MAGIRRHHRLAYVASEGLSEGRKVLHRSIGAELARRMRIGTDPHPLRRVLDIAAPYLGKRDEEALVRV